LVLFLCCCFVVVSISCLFFFLLLFLLGAKKKKKKKKKERQKAIPVGCMAALVRQARGGGHEDVVTDHRAQSRHVSECTGLGEKKKTKTNTIIIIAPATGPLVLAYRPRLYM
jgi:hypothetical protein